MSSISEASITDVSWKDYYHLCKPRVVAVLLLTALVGMCLADSRLPNPLQLFVALLGIGLCASSAAAFNHVLDRRFDVMMARTRHRPLPTGHLRPSQAIAFACIIGVIGFLVLFEWVNPLTAYLTLASLLGYAVIYTAFLKRATPQNITIGGLAGAMPPLLGWVAVTGEIEPNSLLLVLIIFAWTPPHFWALAIHKRKEYALAGVPMLPVTHGVAFTRLQILLYTLLLILTTALPFVTGMSGIVYLLGVAALNLRMLMFALQLYNEDESIPIKMFWYSIRYIMWLFALLLVDHYLSW
ncbi:Protoheme IX farnesyltransferase [Marinomonas aquimarina]|uniref:Protoheme IX farnesyltransferase n=1 Tax=Marinomonas aquimarina TaxID=295068 RepID=A0A1A8TSL8_9GAMM|nr:heme o synthase [Marinomonas aquimarina]SBS36301.1 Protoheme IX farnesyltransferase [Marinomonas aquimarina]